MDRNSIVGLVIIAGILITWGYLNKPTPEEIAERQHKLDSIALVQRQLDEQQRQQQNAATNINNTQAQAQAQEHAIDSIRKVQYQSELGLFGQAAFGEKDYTIIENDVLKLTIAHQGGKPYSVELKDYKKHDQSPLILFSGDSTIFGLNFFSQNRSIKTNELFFEAQQNSDVLIASENPQTASFRLKAGDDAYIEYLYTLSPGSYMVDFSMKFINMDQVIAQNTNALDVIWDMYMPQQEKGWKNENQWSALYYKHYKDNVESFRLRSKKELEEENIPTKLKWVAFKDQFFSSVLIADESFTNGALKSNNMPEDAPFIKKMRAELGIPYDHLAQESKQFRFYFGPNKYKLLKQYNDIELNELVILGKNIIRFINVAVIIPLFDFLNNFINSYGLIILLLTIIIKMGLFPLTYRSYLSQARMRVLKPQIDEINKKFPADKAMERQKATMDLYRKVGINPMGGCLPMILQMPILFAMFRFFPTSIELRQESFLWAHDLSTYDAIISWDKTIPIISNLFGNHISLFTILMTVTTILSMKTNTQAASTSQMPGMKGMMYIMPVMFLFVLNSYSSGLTYYYFLANLITFGQNAIFKQMIDEDAILKKLEARKAKPKKKSNFQKRLEEAAKQRGYQAPKR